MLQPSPVQRDLLLVQHSKGDPFRCPQPGALPAGRCRVWFISARGRKWHRWEFLILALSAVYLELGSQFVRRPEFWNSAGEEECFMCLMCALDGCGRWGHHRGCVGCVTEQTQQLKAHLLIFCMQNYTGAFLQMALQSPPFPNLTGIDPWVECRMNEFDFCRGEMMLWIVPHISILFRNPIIAANQTRKVSLFSEWCYLFICQSALHFLRSQTSPCLAMLIL